MEHLLCSSLLSGPGRTYQRWESRLWLLLRRMVGELAAEVLLSPPSSSSSRLCRCCWLPGCSCTRSCCSWFWR